MKFANKRAQTATEYLIILAVVIIIALIVVGVLGGIPGIGGSSRASARTAYWQTTEIGVPSYSFSQTGDDSLTLQNNKAGPIIIERVSLNSDLSAVSSSSSTIFENDTVELAINQTMAPGESYTYRNGTNPSGYIADTWNGVDCVAGETYTIYIWVQWKDVNTQARYNFDGGKVPLTGVCGN